MYLLNFKESRRMTLWKPYTAHRTPKPDLSSRVGKDVEEVEFLLGILKP